MRRLFFPTLRILKYSVYSTARYLMLPFFSTVASGMELSASSPIISITSLAVIISPGGIATKIPATNADAPAIFKTVMIVIKTMLSSGFFDNLNTFLDS